MPLFQPAGYGTYQMMYPGKTLNLKQRRNLNAARVTTLSQIITQQVNDHKVLSSILLAILQFLRQTPIFSLIP
jgi:hypothetical protein